MDNSKIAKEKIVKIHFKSLHYAKIDHFRSNLYQKRKLSPGKNSKLTYAEIRISSMQEHTKFNTRMLTTNSP